MNSRYAWMFGLVAGLALMASSVPAAEGNRLLTIENAVNVEYDDNIYQTDGDKDSSFKLSDTISLALDRTGETSFASLRYRVTGMWWDDRPSDDFDLYHLFDLVWNQRLSRRTNLELSDTFMYAQLPELRNDNLLVRNENNYAYNTANATLGTVLTTATSLDVSARSVLLRYDEDVVADVEDYNAWVGGVTLRNQLQPTTSIFVDARYEMLDYINAGDTVSSAVTMPGTMTGTPEVYEVPDRGAQTFQGGLGIERTFSPSLMGSLAAGGSYRDYESANSGSDTAPYIDGTLTLSPARAMRVSLNVAHSLYQSSLSTYAGQESTRGTLGLGYDLTAKISLTLSATYLYSEYDASSSVDNVNEDQVEDGTEDAFIFGSTLSYALDRRNRVDAGWYFTELDSELRPDYQRNRYTLGWAIRL